MKHFVLFSTIVFILLQTAVFSVNAQTITLKFDGITGSSTLAGAKGLIDVASYGTSAGCATCAVVANSGSGKITPGKIVFNLNSEAEIISLKSLLFSGKVSTNAFFIFSKAAGASGASVGTSTDYYVVGLGNVIVLEIDESAASGSGKPVFQVSLGYSEVAYYFRAQSPDGMLAAAKQSAWNFGTNNANVDSKVALPSGY
jgi:type VI protein secretion system component Hcp